MSRQNIEVFGDDARGYGEEAHAHAQAFGEQAYARAPQVCQTAGMSELSSRAFALLRHAASCGAPSVSAMGAAVTGLLAVYWILQMARALIWPSCICIILLAVFAPKFSICLLLELVPPPIQRMYQRAMCTSAPQDDLIAADVATQSPPAERAKPSEASLLLADSYLLLPKIMTLPDTTFQHPSLLPFPALRFINPAPVHFGYPFPRPLPSANEAAMMSTNARIDPEVGAEYIIGHAAVRNQDAFYANPGFGDFMKRPMEKPVKYKTPEADFESSYIPNYENTVHPAISSLPGSNTSITLSNFCLAMPTCTRLTLDSKSSDFLASELSPKISLEEVTHKTSSTSSESSRPIMGFFTPETNSFILSSRVPGTNDSGPCNTISDISMGTDNSSECQVLRIPSEDNTSIDTPSLTTVDSAQNVETCRVSPVTEVATFGAPDDFSDSSDECLCSVGSVALSSVDLMTLGGTIPPLAN